MTKIDFLKVFVTRERIYRSNSHYRGDLRAIKHAVLLNGWTIPIQMLTALKKILPDSTQVIIHNPLCGFDIALEFRYESGQMNESGRITFYKSFVDEKSYFYSDPKSNLVDK